PVSKVAHVKFNCIHEAVRCAGAVPEVGVTSLAFARIVKVERKPVVLSVDSGKCDRVGAIQNPVSIAIRGLLEQKDCLGMNGVGPCERRVRGQEWPGESKPQPFPRDRMPGAIGVPDLYPQIAINLGPFCCPPRHRSAVKIGGKNEISISSGSGLAEISCARNPRHRDAVLSPSRSAREDSSRNLAG